MKPSSPLRPYHPVNPALQSSKEPKAIQEAGFKAAVVIWAVLRWTFRLLTLAILLLLGLAGGAYAGLYYSFENLPDISRLEFYAPVETTEILDANGKLLYQMHGEENRKVIALHEIPAKVQRAVISAEDGRFYEHYGVDPIGLLRALKVNFNQGETVQGGSSITQQVVKNMFLTPERTIPRKLAEMWMAIEVEKRYSKAQILELYLNQVYWGHNAYGIEAASQNYFGKSAKQLNLAEGSLLAGILTGPELYSPYHSPKLAKQRQKLTLQRMVEVGFISPEEAEQTGQTPLKYPGIKAGVMKHPYYTSYVMAMLKQNYGNSLALKRGMRVHTAMNTDWQVQGEKMLTQYIQQRRGNRISEGALVAIENDTGLVRAIVGGTDYKKSQFNRAWQARRQPGSAFKPFVYLTAFARGYKPEHIEVDEPIQYRRGSYLWKPKNYAGGHSGAMTLQRALEFSNNIIAVKMADRVGNGNVVETAHRLGIRSPLQSVLSLALGPSEVTPLEMASAYSSIARGGSYLEPTPILWIEDRHGNIIEDNRHRTPEQVYSQEACSKLIKVMKGVIERGTAPQARLGRPAAGKTGTTSDHKDAWFVGFTPQISAAVWIGNDRPVPMYGYATGGHLSAPLWARFMRYTHAKLKVRDFEFAKGNLPLLAGVALDDEQSHYNMGYERMNKSLPESTIEHDPFAEIDPFLINPNALEEPIDQAVPMKLPAISIDPGKPVKTLSGQPAAPSAPPKNQKIIQELDQLIQELDRLEVPVEPKSQ